jgi:hypothetical protein
MPEEVFLKRSEETFALRRVFSQMSNESTGTIINRISKARYLGLKVREVRDLESNYVR